MGRLHLQGRGDFYLAVSHPRKPTEYTKEAVRRDSSAVSLTVMLCGQACGQFRGV